ncbi:MAG: hypothetical protein IKC65_08905, partial [Lentisphaeria bacterium]|nr:hypothetical protein [Lentisphaeria bacterium]
MKTQLSSTCITQHQNTPLFLKAKGSVTCQTGVLYNRCGMLSLWGGALKTDIGAPQNTAGFAQQQNIPLFFESERGFGGKRKPSFLVKRKFSLSP